jgi:phosphoribosyl-AMP cyclohydrolase
MSDATNKEKEEKEEGRKVMLDFGKLRETVKKNAADVIPIVLQDADTMKVLFIGNATRETFLETLAIGKAVLWSMSRDKRWFKGETSGSFLEIVKVLVNCEQNSALFMVKSVAGACHTKNKAGQFRDTCYYREIKVRGENMTLEFLPGYE